MLRTRVEHVEESMRLRWLQINTALNSIEFNTSMILKAEVLLERLYEEKRIDGIIKLCLTGK